MRVRIERDELGTKEIPYEAYYGIQTLRSKENFDIVKRPICRHMIKALAIIKKSAAKANCDAGLIAPDVCDAICMACDEILNGRLHGQFITDLIQGGAGTSINMNANEVIANRANEMLGGRKGEYNFVHPMMHVNLSQSTNDVIPTAGKIAAIKLTKKLLAEMKKLAGAYNILEKKYNNVVVVGKTHLQDSVLITFGRIFKSIVLSIERDIKTINLVIKELYAVNMGGPLAGTASYVNPVYAENIAKYLAEFSGEPIVIAKDLVENSRHASCFSLLSKAVMNFALNLYKNANDLRLMASCFKTVILPNIQSGSALNLGRSAPVVPEMVIQVVLYTEGNDLTISHACAMGELEFNTNMPIIFACLFENLNFVRRAIRTLREKCLEEMQVVGVKDIMSLESGILASLQTKIGYKTCQEVVNIAGKENKSIMQVLLENNYISKDDLTLFLNKKEENDE